MQIKQWHQILAALTIVLATFLLMLPALSHAAQAPGFPQRDVTPAELRRAFTTPPPGYGQVPFWWWTGEPLNRERLLWQLDELHKAGVSGAQINYSHTRSDGWRTEKVEPPIFSDEWWDIFAFMAVESAKRGMGIGMSGYTLDWPGRDNLFRQLGITTDDLHAHGLTLRTRDIRTADDAQPLTPLPHEAAAISVTALPLRDGRPLPVDKRSLDPRATSWTLPKGAWRLLAVLAERRPDTLDPLNPLSGQRVIERFFNPFLARTPPEARGALNYFFQDELRLAGDKHLWSDTFAAEFQQRKGYDVRPVLAALFTDLGPETPKVRLDVNDVMVSLSETYYFKPIFEWHNSRGMIYACDPASRGRDPMEFGDYMRAMRWYTAPGFDTPGSSADLIKNKVGSSIAHLYERPRVWVEGYHSLGWQASPTVLFDSSNRNFLYGTTLLNLHGLYYTTFGGWWEWAPPCYHFRMPYWRHMPVFFKYFERLSYLLSQGDHVADVAIIQPHEPLVVDPARGKAAQSCAYALAADLIAQQIDFDFIDAESLARAEIVPPGESRTRLRPDTHARLCVAGEAYRALVLPGMFAIRHASLEKALAFQQAGGRVIALGELPEATDRAGSDDPQTAALVKRLFAPDSGALHWTPPAASDARPPRTYAKHFTGRWVWTRKPTPQAVFKHVWNGAAGEYQAAMLCDNSGTLYLNGRTLATWSSYREPWVGTVSLAPGDVLAAAVSDGPGETGNKTAGLFFALVRDGATCFSAEQFHVRPGRASTEWLASRDLDGLEPPDPSNVHAVHQGEPPAPQPAAAHAIRALIGTPDFSGPAGAKALHRRIGRTDVYFIMDLREPAVCTFRAHGTPERWNAWTGEQTPIAGAIAHTNGTTSVHLDADGSPLLLAFTDAPPPPAAVPPAPQTSRTLALDGEWDFTLIPTCDNRWGDFRLPAFDGLIGAEARHLTWDVPGMPSRMTYSHGPQFRAFGPLPPGAETDALVQALASATSLAPGTTVTVNGRAYTWKPFCFSWREGVENYPAYQNWHHGLNRKVGDEFFVLGNYDRNLYDVKMPDDAVPETRVYQTTVFAAEPCRAEIVSSGVAPSAVWLGGVRHAPGDTVALRAGRTPLLVRYDAFGRAALVLYRADIDTDRPAHPLAMRWFGDSAVLPFDCFDGGLTQATYSFQAPPALAAAEVTLHGDLLAATFDDQEAVITLLRDLNSVRVYRVTPSGQTAQSPNPRPVVVRLAVKHAPGHTGGAAFPEPVRLTCGTGKMTAGDWARVDALSCYSGGAVYARQVTLTQSDTKGPVVLDLGGVGATCEVAVNGEPVRVLVCPPWRVDLTGRVKAGDNQLAITVYNTLNNHYQTIPTRYRKPTAQEPSGLLGPVRLLLP